jgi:CheY-like chemotaxis protein
MSNKGYEVFAASNGIEALDIVSRVRGIQLILTDICMAGMNGKELAEHIIKQNPATKIVFMSGLSENLFKPGELENKKARFISKPFSIAELLEIIYTTLKSS